MRVNKNKGKCLFGPDERTPDVYTAVTASYCLGLSILKTRETILMKYVSLHLKAIKTESNLMLKLKYRKEMQEEMKSEKESPLEKTNKDITLPCALPYLPSVGEHCFCSHVSFCTDYATHCKMKFLGLKRTIGTESLVVLVSIPRSHTHCHCHCHQVLPGSSIMVTLE